MLARKRVHVLEAASSENRKNYYLSA